MLDKKTLSQDLMAAASVTCVSVPLNLAIGIASGVPPQVALVTAGVSAPVAALLGGTTLTVTGPSPVMSVLICQAVNTHGLGMLPIITCAVGALQMLAGIFNTGWFVKLTPIPVIAGFTTGVGVLIGVGQLPRFLGLASAGPDASPFQTLSHVAMNLTALDPTSLGIGAVSLATAMLLPRLAPKAGGLATLAAVGAGSATCAALATQGAASTVAVVGSMPPLALSDLFRLPSLATGDLFQLVPTVLLLASLTSVESLLSCMAVEKMRQTPYRHDSSQELIGQGAANMVSGCFMGMPVTSVIARSGLNVQSNAQTRLPAALQGLAVLLGVSTLGPVLAAVPMPALAAVLLTASSKMLWPAEITHAVRVQRTDALPYAATVLGMLSLGLAEGIAVGVITSLVFSGANWNQPKTAMMSFGKAKTVRVSLELYSAAKLWEMDKERLIRLILSNYESGEVTSGALECPECGGEGQVLTVMSSHDVPDDLTKTCPTCMGTGMAPRMGTLPTVWWLDGPLNFMSVFRIASLVEAVKALPPENGRAIFDLHGCRSLDLTGAEALLNGLDVLQSHGVKVTLMNPPPQFESALFAYSTFEPIHAYSPSFSRPVQPTPGPGPGTAFAWR